MNIIIGSARIGENGRITGGKVGDQKQNSDVKDLKGEVSMQPFYVHSKGWIILRPKSIEHSHNLAVNMKNACNNPNIGYNQDERYGVVKYGTKTKIKTNSDCSSLVRQCVKEATGKDPGDFSTANEAEKLMATGLFQRLEFVSQNKTPIYNGDILVTKTKGHTAIVCTGNPRPRKEVESEIKAPESNFKPYSVEIIADMLYVRSGPATSYPVKMYVRKYDTYTIVEEINGWGKLKSGAGWISLKFAKRV